MKREDFTRMGVGVLLGYIFARFLDVLTRKGRVEVLPVPYMPAMPPSKPDTKPLADGGPVLLTTNPIPVTRGKGYRVVLSVGFPFNLIANQDSVRSQAQVLGFTDVKVFKDRPLDFPGSRQGDFYIEGKWGGTGSTIARPNIQGIHIVEVWEG